ncbi:hypothetical protein LTR85_009623 [Meristemomyces frigidus]|nr:hypothetical protein LTR85_009623 [Meristemomyces frigidus]
MGATQTGGLARQKSLASDLDKVMNLEFGPLGSASSDPPSRRVVNTTELLEAILIHLPTRDILLAQRTSKKFQNVIAGSPRLQRALFFLPDSPDTVQRYNDLILGDSFFRKYPAFLAGRNGINFGKGDFHACLRAVDFKTDRTGGKELVVDFTSAGMCREGMAEEHKVFYGITGTLPCVYCRGGVPLEAGSWQRMSLCQPPMDVVFALTIADGSKHRIPSAGRTMAEIVEL